MKKGQSEHKSALDIAAERLLGYEVPKNAEIRLTFRQGMLMTPEHFLYAAKDAAVTAQLYEHMQGEYATEWYHVAGLIVLASISRNGMLVDMPYMLELQKLFQEKVDKERFILSHWGYYQGRDGNQKIHQNILKFLEGVMGIALPRTPSGMISADKEVMEEHFGFNPHPFIASQQKLGHATKMLSTYLNPDHIGVDGRVHSRYDPLKKTGRTSSSGPNMQNVPRKEGLRGCYIAPPGHVLYACDYGQLELCTLAESNYLRFGGSRMRDLINEGHDLHFWFGQKIKEKDPRPEEEKLADKDYRQMAKAANFGLPGGLGVATFQGYAANTYGVEMDVETCTMLKKLWLDTFPENKEHLAPPKDTKFSNRDEDMYIAQTVNGRVRRNATYCSSCNYPFQGLAADGAKVALWYLYIEGFKIVNFIHDEVIIELPKDNHLQQRIRRVDELMLFGMEQVVKHVKIKVEGALMERWYKEAEPIHGDNGELLIWSPELAKQLEEIKQLQGMTA
jgi:DNA polymerase-1